MSIKNMQLTGIKLAGNGNVYPRQLMLTVLTQSHPLALRKTMRAARYILMFGFIMIMIGQLAPMTLMREPHHPWYIGYTTVWGMLSFLVFSPAILGTALIGQTAILGQEGLSVAHWILNIIWLIFLCYLVSRTNAIIPGAAANIAWQQRPAPPDHRLEERPKNH